MATPWIEYVVQQGQFFQKTLEETFDSAVEVTRSRLSEIRSTSSAHLHQTLDMLQHFKSEFDGYEDLFFGKLKEGIVLAASNPTITGATAVGLGVLVLKRPRRFLTNNTLRLFVSEESLLSKADAKLKDLRQSVDLVKAESEKLEKRALQAEEEMRRGRTKLRQAGNQIQGVIRSAYKIERRARGLKDFLGELPSREASHFRSQETRSQRSLVVWKMGTINYFDALKLQEKLVSDRKFGKISDTVLSLQHPPTYTLGKRRTYHNLLVPEADLQTMGAELHYTQRGGDITFHGPHQAILYPIISLRDIGLGVRKYVENLELTMIELASLYGVRAHVGSKCETGVWVGDRKIGAIGVQISSGITSHGLAFNIDPDLNYFKHIVPCGIVNKGVTSLRRETEKLLPAEEVIHEQLVSCFARLFGFDTIVWKENLSILPENQEIR